MDAWLADEVGDERLTGVYLGVRRSGGGPPCSGSARASASRSSTSGSRSCSARSGRSRWPCSTRAGCPRRGSRPRRLGQGAFAHMAHTGRAGAGSCARDLLLAFTALPSWACGASPTTGSGSAPDRGRRAATDRRADPVVWFGILGVSGTLLSIAVAAPVGRRLEHGSRATVARALGWLYASLAVSSLCFARRGLARRARLVRDLRRAPGGRAALHRVAEPERRRLDRPRDDALYRQPGRRDRPVDGRPGDRRARDGHLHPRRARRCHRGPGHRPRVPARRDPRTRDETGLPAASGGAE